MISRSHKLNFQTLVRAARTNDICLMECHTTSGLAVYTICALNRLPDGQIESVPLARMFDGNPYDEVIPPLRIKESTNDPH